MVEHLTCNHVVAGSIPAPGSSRPSSQNATERGHDLSGIEDAGVGCRLRHPVRTFVGVPRISSFHGIVIAMYFDDHPPAHFHARFGEHEAQIAIATGEILRGQLPRRVQGLVEEWVELRRDELLDDWARAERQEPLRRIAPLP